MLRWYDRHRRELPWRALPHEKADPYRVWLSEMMLQQTTVATVTPYFNKFIRAWPTLTALAGADLDDILRVWAGLGYYRRAKLLHEAARILQADFKGHFPDDEAVLRSLPGIGVYTAAAIAAIAFDKPANVVDGNVERVMARLFLVDEPLPHAKKTLRGLAATLVPSRRPGDYAQALMDLGATVCTPRAPSCSACPWKRHCRAFALGKEGVFPRRRVQKAKPIRKTTAFVLLNDRGDVLLRRRPSHGLLANMMEVPTSPWHKGEAFPQEQDFACTPAKAVWTKCPGVVRHVFSHFILEAVVFKAVVRRKHSGTWVSLADLDKQALPSVMEKIIRRACLS